MRDDAAYAVSSTFGGMIPTPSLDRIAKGGLRYTNSNGNLDLEFAISVTQGLNVSKEEGNESQDKK